ncbi:MAG: hypothetical protein WCT40_02730 [Candidatus Magasanikbacteria bacterium]|jgi:hypothetical protein
MFGKKRMDNIADENILVHTMPAEFFGGANPVVQFKKVTRTVLDKSSASVLTSAEKALMDKATVAGGGNRWHPANFFASQKFLWTGVGVFFLVFVAGAGIYYFTVWRGLRANQAPTPPAVTYNTPPVGDIVSEPAPETTPEIVPVTIPEVIPVIATNELEFPSILLADSVDLDQDGITDLAEETFATEPGVPDTDSDKYSDFTEVNNLYNPAGIAPMRIIDSGLVKDYSNPNFGYQMYYPNNWALGVVDESARVVLFSTLTGENIEMHVFDLAAGESFADWFAKNAIGQKFSDLTTFAGAFDEKGLRRSDGLIYYFGDATHVYALLYHTTDSNTVNYRSVINMMARSFRLENNTIELPLQMDIESASEEVSLPTPVVATNTVTTTL